ncbi:MAG TPA: hypothetical protein VGO58_06060 [Chitinophagaceae bacterium]|jgi:hypothetical protein|nr:hypothetical protein [Chitinophagaceae bacterium]
MIDQYIKEKRTIKQKIGAVPKLFLTHWMIAVSSASFILLIWLISGQVSNTMLVQSTTMVITAASILAAVLITFLVEKVVQLRQEKRSMWNEYHKLTQQVHHFRGAIYPLYKYL